MYICCICIYTTHTYIHTQVHIYTRLHTHILHLCIYTAYTCTHRYIHTHHIHIDVYIHHPYAYMYYNSICTQYLYVHMCNIHVLTPHPHRIFLGQLSVDGHLGGFHILVIIINAAISIGCKYLFELVFLYFLDVNLEVELLDNVVILFRFLRKLHSDFCSDCIDLHSHQQCRKGSLSPRSSPALIIHRLFDILI